MFLHHANQTATGLETTTAAVCSFGNNFVSLPLHKCCHTLCSPSLSFFGKRDFAYDVISLQNLSLQNAILWKNCRVPYCFPMCNKAYLVKNCFEKLKFETKSRIVHRLEFVEWNMPNSSADASGLLFLLETTKKSFEPSLWNLEIYVQLQPF